MTYFTVQTRSDHGRGGGGIYWKMLRFEWNLIGGETRCSRWSVHECLSQIRPRKAQLEGGTGNRVARLGIKRIGLLCWNSHLLQMIRGDARNAPTWVKLHILFLAPNRIFGVAGVVCDGLISFVVLPTRNKCHMSS